MISTRKNAVSQRFWQRLYRIPQGMTAIAAIAVGLGSTTLASPMKPKATNQLIQVAITEASSLARSAQPLLAQRGPFAPRQTLPAPPASSTPAPVPPPPVQQPSVQPTPGLVVPAPVQSTPAPPQPNSGQSPPGVMVPNPQVIIQNSQPSVINQTIPPMMPRAIAPPVGDMSITSTDASTDIINLGTNARIDRLVLRDTPARDILSTLVRAAGLNFAYTGDPTGGNLPPGQLVVPGGSPGQVYTGPLITIDLGNESIQTAFNTILRLSNFEANRVGDTIMVGPKLPNGAKGLISRSLRLNQVSVGVALNFLVAMGAESAISRERTVTTVNAVPVGANFGGDSGGNFASGVNNPSVATQTQTSTESRVEVQRVAFQDGQPLLRGLQVVGDERTNTLTLMGSPQQLQIATSHLIQLDSRRRQAVINVRIIDVNLTALKETSSSFSFGVDDTFTVVDQGLAVVNFGTARPPTVDGQTGSITSPQPQNDDTRFPFTKRFLARLQSSIQQGSAKILTDPTLTVQEGQTAQVNLTQEIFGGLRIQQSATGSGGSSSLTTQEPIIKQAGLTLTVKIDRIDDNGFISLSVAPTVSAPNGFANAGTSGTIALLSQRTLSSGQLRLRDGQTLVLAGIIQENDRVDVTKIPLLGDIPLLGALFRRTNRDNQRQEVIVLMTPQIIDDSDRANFGYGYIPSPDASKMLQRDRQLNPLRKKR